LIRNENAGEGVCGAQFKRALFADCQNWSISGQFTDIGQNLRIIPYRKTAARVSCAHKKSRPTVGRLSIRLEDRSVCCGSNQPTAT
jgi:hypothetical protein